MFRLITAGLGLALVAAPIAAFTSTATASDASADRQAPAYSVSAKINKTTAIAKEDTVKIRGRVTPRAAGQKVVLQQRMEGKKSWSVSGKAKVKASGKFLLKDKPTVAGTRFYRVLKPAAGTLKKGVSKEQQLVVYGWEKLGFRAQGPATNTWVNSVTIATENYPVSLVTQVAGTPSTIEYTLGKKCLKLRSSYALTDATATGGTGSVALAADGKPAYSTVLSLGQIVTDQVTDVTDVFRISYALTSNASPESYVAAATPEVLCTK